MKSYTRVAKVPGIPEAGRQALEAVTQRFTFRVNEYYLNLIEIPRMR